MSQLYCNVDNMPVADLASSVYPASSAVLGGACPALSAVPKISRILVGYLACLIVDQFEVTPYISGTADTRAGGLARRHRSQGLENGVRRTLTFLRVSL